MATKRRTSIRDKHRARLRASTASCHVCGGEIDYELPSSHPNSFVVDHIVALARGGTDTLDNKRAAHRRCNSMKSDRVSAPIIRRSGSLR